MNTVVDFLVNTIAVHLIVGCILVLVCFVCLRFMRFNATTRHSTWMICLALLCMMPLLTFVSSFFDDSLSSHQTSIRLNANDLTGDVETGSKNATLFDSGSNPFSLEGVTIKNSALGDSVKVKAVKTSQQLNIGEWFKIGLLILLSIGFCIKTILYTRSIWAVKKLHSNSTEVSDFRADEFRQIAAKLQLNKLPQLRESEELTTPMTAGCIRPWVLLPLNFGRRQSETQLLQEVLLHELAHVRRRDTLMATLQSFVAVFLFWHPAFFIINRQLREERELAADDWVVNSLNLDNTQAINPNSHYASTLVTVAKQVISPTQAVNAVACVGDSQQLRYRVEHLLSKESVFSISKQWTTFLAVSLCLFAGFSFSAPLWPSLNINELLINADQRTVKNTSAEEFSLPNAQSGAAEVHSSVVDREGEDVVDLLSAQTPSNNSIQNNSLQNSSLMNRSLKNNALKNQSLTKIILTIEPGDNLSLLFKQLELSEQTLVSLLTVQEAQALSRFMQPGQAIEFSLSDDKQLQQLRWMKSQLETLVFTRTEEGFDYRTEKQSPVIETRFAQGYIQRSLFESADKLGLDPNVSHHLAELFAWDINFAKDIRPNDSFKVLYEELSIDKEVVGVGRILAAEFVNQGQVFNAFLYADAKGNTEYYNAEGINVRSAFLQAPLDYRRVSSHFNPRRLHPIAKVVRPHRGTDYAADRGTPVWSVGDGEVIESSYTNSNGHYIVVQHGQHFQTKYLHLDKRSAKVGDRVSQKQVLGTVGSTGLATGPHLHYEFLVDGVHKDPREVLKTLPTYNAIAVEEAQQFLQKRNTLLVALDQSGLGVDKKNLSLAMSATDSSNYSE